jgi:predicted small secreted protein
MYSPKRLIALAVAAAFSTAALSACNTVEGAGKDIKSTGRAIEQKAKEEKAERRAKEQAEHAAEHTND